MVAHQPSFFKRILAFVPSPFPPHVDDPVPVPPDDPCPLIHPDVQDGVELTQIADRDLTHP
jgi:hypothetical protein